MPDSSSFSLVVYPWAEYYQCWCGHFKTDFDKHGKADCDQPCSGDADEVCGGAWAMSVYQDGGKPDSVPEGSKYLGCYADKNDRALTLGGTVSTNEMTHQVNTSFECNSARLEIKGLYVACIRSRIL